MVMINESQGPSCLSSSSRALLASEFCTLRTKSSGIIKSSSSSAMSREAPCCQTSAKTNGSSGLVWNYLRTMWVRSLTDTSPSTDGPQISDMYARMHFEMRAAPLQPEQEVI